MTRHMTGTREEWLAPLGRNETGGVWWHRHDEYVKG